VSRFLRRHGLSVGSTERNRPLPWHMEYGVEFRRGFVEHLMLTVPEFLEHAGDLFRHFPIRDLFLTSVPPSPDEALFDSPFLSRLQRLHLCLERQELACLLRCPHLASLRDLCLEGSIRPCPLLADFANSKLLQQLTKLAFIPWNRCHYRTFEHAEVTEASAAVGMLVASPGCQNLTMLDLICNDIGDRGAGLLANSPHLTR